MHGRILTNWKSSRKYCRKAIKLLVSECISYFSALSARCTILLGIVTGEIKAEPDRFDSEEYVGEDATGFTIDNLYV